MKRFLSGVIAVVALLVSSSAGCGSKTDTLGNAALLLLDATTHHLTLRNTGDTDLVDCSVIVTYGQSETVDRPDRNEVKVAVLHHAESIDIPLSTFQAYRDRTASPVVAGFSPLAQVTCYERNAWAFTGHGRVHDGYVFLGEG